MATNEDFVIGRHPAVAALKSKQAVNKVFLQSGLKWSKPPRGRLGCSGL